MEEHTASIEKWHRSRSRKLLLWQRTQVTGRGRSSKKRTQFFAAAQLFFFASMGSIPSPLLLLNEFEKDQQVKGPHGYNPTCFFGPAALKVAQQPEFGYYPTQLLSHLIPHFFGLCRFELKPSSECGFHVFKGPFWREPRFERTRRRFFRRNSERHSRPHRAE